jgi:ferredoxin-type protein NapG
MEDKSSISRRTLCIGIGSTVALAALGSVRFLGTQTLVRPPGGQNETQLLERCIHCYRCIEVCPQQVIVAASLDTGLLNMRTPQMSFSDCYPGQLENFRYCDLCAEENGGVPLCVEACPSHALELDESSLNQEVTLGVAQLDTNLCIAYRSSYCAYCYEVCQQVKGEEDAAIYYVNSDSEGSDATRLPVVDAEKCTGCGACEAVCVSTQAGSTKNASKRAIVIVSVEEVS